MVKENILERIPDKRQERNTTSLKFKEDLISFLGDNYKNKICLEIGTHKGYSTRVLSTLFKKVITCETNTEYINFAKNLNSDRKNIDFLEKDVYNTKWDFTDIDAVFIDCNHHIDYVMKDIYNAISLCKENEELLLIFDDYGLDNPWEGVKESVDKFLKDIRFNLVRFIGEHKGSDCNPRANLLDEEGVICTYSKKSLQKFIRIFDGNLYEAGEVLKLGFEESEGLRIPDDYLETQEFIILRTAWGIGDWGIISAMPRLLKEKYPNCKVYITSKKFVKNLFGIDLNIMNLIFENNPYIDGFKDEIDGEIFHDHYRIYNNDTDIPLVEQMLKFWQFEEDEYKDSQPELYWSDGEKKLGDDIIKQYVGDNEFGALLISNRFGTQYGKFDEVSYKNDFNKMKKLLEENNIPYFYWSYSPLDEIRFDFINKILDMRNMNLRIQLYIKSKAKINISNQCGTNQLISRYSTCYEIQRQFPIGHNLVRGEIYI